MLSKTDGFLQVRSTSLPVYDHVHEYTIETTVSKSAYFNNFLPRSDLAPENVMISVKTFPKLLLMLFDTARLDLTNSDYNGKLEKHCHG